MAKETVTAEVAPAKRTRKPRDPNAPRVDRPVFVVFSLDRTEGVSDKDAVSLHVATRNAAEAIEALEGHQGATYKKVLVKGARTAG